MTSLREKETTFESLAFAGPLAMIGSDSHIILGFGSIISAKKAYRELLSVNDITPSVSLASFRYDGTLVVDITELQTKLEPYSHSHLVLFGFGPIISTKKAYHQQPSLDDITTLASLRFHGNLVVNITELQTKLGPYPHTRFMLFGHEPIIIAKKAYIQQEYMFSLLLCMRGRMQILVKILPAITIPSDVKMKECLMPSPYAGMQIPMQTMTAQTIALDVVLEIGRTLCLTAGILLEDGHTLSEYSIQKERFSALPDQQRLTIASTHLKECLMLSIYDGMQILVRTLTAQTTTLDSDSM